MRHFRVSFPPGDPHKGVYYTSQRAVSTVDLTHSENHQRHLSRSNCWTPDHWMLGGVVTGVTPLARLGNLLCPQTCYHLRPLCLHSHCSTRVQKSRLGTGTYVSLKLHSWLLTNENSVRPSSNTVNCPIISAALLAVLFTDQLFISIYQTQMKVEHAKRLLNFSISYGKIVTSDCSQYLPIFIQCGRIYASCLSFFSNHRSVMDQKLNWNVRLALEPRSYLHFIIYRQLALSPFLY